MDKVVAGRYRLVRPMTHGAMGAVYEAEDIELARRVALKLLTEKADPRRFEREAMAFAALDHSAIVRLFDVGEVEGRPFLVLELLSGGTLEDRLAREAPFEDAESSRLAAQIASALAHAHARGIVHRDLKPANILLDDAGDARLGDFGIAAARGASTLTDPGTIIGTAAYMAPEQARGEATTPRTDVYAFGVVLYRMLTGRLPFAGDDAMEVARKQVEEEPVSVLTLRPDAPPDLAVLAMAALAKNPDDRPADGSALVAALRAAEDEDDTVVVADAAPRVASLPWSALSRRHATGVGLALIVPVVLAAGFGMSALLERDSTPAKAPVNATRTTKARGDTARSTPPGTGTTPSAATASSSATTASSPTTVDPTTAPTSTRPPTTVPVAPTEPEPEPTTSEELPTTDSTTTAPETTTTPSTTDAATTAPADG